MKTKNAIVLLKFGKINKMHKGKPVMQTRLFIKLYKDIKTQQLSLLNSELYEDETLMQNTKKEIWNHLYTESITVFKGEYYDDFEDKFGERTIHCCNICLLDKNVVTDDDWYEIQLSDNTLILQNTTEKYDINFEKRNSKIEITSSNILLMENNTIMLIEALLKLKNEFYFTTISLEYVDDVFTMSDLLEIFNCFSQKPFSKSTLKRRMMPHIELVNETDMQAKNSKASFKKRTTHP